MDCEAEKGAIPIWKIYARVTGCLDGAALATEKPYLLGFKYIAFCENSQRFFGATLEGVAEKIWNRYGASAIGQVEIYEIPEILACDPRNAGSVLGLEADRRKAGVIPFRRRLA